jgi:hypothetical protein
MAVSSGVWGPRFARCGLGEIKLVGAWRNRLWHKRIIQEEIWVPISTFERLDGKGFG